MEDDYVAIRAQAQRPARALLAFAATLLALCLCACGGGDPAPSPGAAAGITAQPTDQSVVAGTTATFTVAASNATGYQWQRSTDYGTTFADVASATATRHTTPVTAPADSGTQYRVVVAGGASNSVTSSAVTLTVTAAVVAPSISVHPASQTITAGQNASFSVTAHGTSIVYKWQRSTDGGSSFADLAGETGATLTLTAVPQADNGHKLRVTVSNSAGSLTSNAALLSVNAAPSVPAFATQPASITVVAPATATFSVAVTGTPSPSLQWQMSTSAGASFADIAGATASSYTTPATGAVDNGHQFRVIATNSAGATTSAVAKLTVNVATAPSFTTQPSNVSVTEGQNAQFVVAATGSPTPTLQWQLSTDSGSTWSSITGATGAAYDVIGAALADNGRQFRAVASNSSGSVNSNAAVLTVLAKTWGTAALIETDNAGHAGAPQIAFDTNGNALAVWRQSDGTRYNIVSNRYTAGSGWGTAAPIETDNGDAVYPQIAFDTNGNALAVWSQYDGTRYYNIVANRYTAGTGWGTAALIETDNAGNAWTPQIAFDTNGNALAVWIQSDVTRNNIWSNRYTAAGWGTATLIEIDNADSASEPQIAFDTNGNALAVWTQGDGTLYNIWSNRFTAGSGWGTATLIETDNAYHASSPQIAFDTNGNALAVWIQSDGTRYNIVANRYTAGSGWGTAAPIETDNAGDAWYPQIGFETNGNALAVWMQHDGSRHNIVANRYTSGTGWGTAAPIETDNGDAVYPQIAFDTNGIALAVWRQSDGTRYNIVANRYTAGSGWGAPTLIEIDNAGSVESPQIAFDTNGNALAVWAQHDGTRFNIVANRYQRAR